MLLFIIFFVAVIFIPYIYMKGRIKSAYFNSILIFSNAGLLVLSLFSFHLIRAFAILGMIIFFEFWLAVIIINILMVITKVVKEKRLKAFLFFLPFLFSTVLAFLIVKNNLSEKIALKFEFKKYQKELDDYVVNNKKTNNIRIFGDYAGIIWDQGFLDSYSVIIFDKNNNLDILYKTAETDFSDKEMYQKFVDAFGYEKIVSLMKIQDNYFRCNIDE